jgi:glutamate--cysteine ligase
MKTINYDGLELSTIILIKDAISRGISVEILDRNDNFIRLKKDTKVKYIKEATKTSIDSYIVPLIMENKEITKRILKENNLNVPKGIMIKTMAQALEYFSLFKGKDIVIKPKSTNFGLGIMILKNIQYEDGYISAIKHALHYDDSVLIEEFITGKEYRFLVIGNEVVGILHRIPANVVGDNIHTIKELVCKKNKDPLRGSGYVTPLEKIKLGETEVDYLKIMGRTITDIPINNEIVYLRENSNISTGGDSIDYTDDILDDYKKIAIASAKAVGAKICGADIIIQNIEEKPTKENYSIIELNFNPALHIHNYPFKGNNREVGKKVLDLLGY